MTIKELNKREAQKKLEEFLNGKKVYLELNDDYNLIRNDIRNLYAESVVYRDNSDTIEGYQTDLNFAINLYKYFNDFNWFNETLASNYNFWAYICVNVVPDIIQDRHGDDPNYYYAKNVRMYIPTLWWYVHMSYQGNLDDTYKALKLLNTDYILQLVERPGRDGMYLSISRKVMYYMSLVPRIEREKRVDKKNLIRRVLIQNTSKINNYNLVFDGKEDLYVKSLFEACGVKVDDYE